MQALDAGEAPTGTDLSSVMELSAYLTAGYWQDHGGDARAWAQPVVTYTLEGGWSAAQQDAIVRALAAWSDVAAIRFEQVALGAPLTLREGSNGRASTAVFVYPEPDIYFARVSIDADVPGWSDLSTPGGYGWMTLLHEIGHAIGLGHGGNYDGTASVERDRHLDADSRQYSLMSYFDAQVTGADHVGEGGRVHASTPLLADILAIQSIYGVNPGARGGDTVYGFGSTLPGTVYDFETTGAPVLSVWDGGGHDMFDFSGFAADQRIDLREGQVSDVGGLSGNVSIAPGAVIEDARGGSGDDILIGNAAANRLWGGGGADVILGGAGQDMAVIGIAPGETPDLTGLEVTGGSANGLLLHAGGTVTLESVEVLCLYDGTRSTWVVLPGMDLAAAVAAAGPGDRLLLAEGGHAGALTLDRPLDVLGAGAGRTVLDGGGGPALVLDTGAGAVSVSGLSLLTQGDGAIAWAQGDGDLLLDGCEVSGAASDLVGACPDGGSLLARNTLFADGTVADIPTGEDTTTQPDAPGAEPDLPVIMEWGQAEVGAEEVRVRFDHAFTRPVVLTMLDGAFADPVAVRLSDVGPDGATMRLQEPRYADGEIAPGTVHWVVVEAGRWHLEDGRILEAGIEATGRLSSRGAVEVATDLAEDAAILGQVQTSEGRDWVIARVAGRTDGGFALTLQEEESRNNSGHVTEQVGWLAVEGGATGGLGAGMVERGVTHRGVLGDGPAVPLAGTVLAGLSSMRGRDSAYLERDASGTGGFAIREDQSRDAETRHVAEDFAVLTLEGEQGSLTGSPAGTRMGEAGHATLGSPHAEVTLAHAYTAPVVVAVEAGDTLGRMLDVQWTSESSFVLAGAEANAPGPVDMMYLVLEAGRWSLPDGTLLDVGLLPGGRGDLSGLAEPLGAGPAIFTAVQTAAPAVGWHAAGTRGRDEVDSIGRIAIAAGGGQEEDAGFVFRTGWLEDGQAEFPVGYEVTPAALPEGEVRPPSLFAVDALAGDPALLPQDDLTGELHQSGYLSLSGIGVLYATEAF